MKTIIRLEELGVFIFSLFLFIQTSYSWWWFPLLILVPDIGMLGYLFNAKTGAVLYNLFHHKGVGLALYMTGFIWTIPLMELAGIILLGHAAMDRLFGYGLKYPDNFQHTHLGPIG